MTKFFVYQAMDMKHYMIGLEHPEWNIMKEGSYGVFEARVLGLSFAKSLEYIRDNFNGIIKGREGYSYIYFKSKVDAEKLAVFLNKRLRQIQDRTFSSY